MWNGTMLVDLDWPLNASSLLSASADLLVVTRATRVIARYVLYGNGNVAGCVSDTRRYCIKTAKPILKLFDRLVAALFWFLMTPALIPTSKGTPLAGAFNTRGWEILTIFDGNRRLSRKWCEIGRWLLWNVNRKSWVPDWIVSSSMTLDDP